MSEIKKRRTKVEREIDNLNDWSEEDLKELRKRLIIAGYDKNQENRKQAELVALTGSSENLKEWVKNDGKLRGLTTGYWTLDRMTAGLCGGDLDVIAGVSSIGKCERKGTKVLMANGTIKKIEDIKIGDYVQSEKGANKVIGKHNGFAKCYKVTPVRGTPFYVSQDHILTVKRHMKISTHRKGEPIYLGVKETLEDTKIENLLKKPYKGNWLSNYYLYRPEIRNYTEKELPIPPYILGIWLGDGSTNGTALTSADESVITAWKEYGVQEGCYSREWVRFNEKLGRESRSKTYHLVTPRGKNNPVRDKLRSIGVWGNKHIPLIYLTASWEQRMQLLAGILDTDGYRHKSHGKGQYEIIQKNKALAENIAQLARGLGCGVAVTEKKGTIDSKVVGIYQRITISAGVEEIPCRVQRRKSKIAGKRTDPRNVGFRIDRVEDAEYYGIQVDGDHRFMLWDNTLTHNTNIVVNMMARQIMLGHKAAFVTLEMSKQSILQRLYSIMGDNFDLAMRDNPILVQKQDRIPYESIKYAVEQAKNWGAEVFYIDHLHYFSRTMENQAEGLGAITQEFKLVAKEYDIPIVLLSQLRKTNGERPTGEDLRGSALIKQDADIVLILDRDMQRINPMDYVRITLDKNRDRLIWGIGSEIELHKVGLDLREMGYDPVLDASLDVTRKARGNSENIVRFGTGN